MLINNFVRKVMANNDDKEKLTIKQVKQTLRIANMISGGRLYRLIRKLNERN